MQDHLPPMDADTRRSNQKQEPQIHTDEHGFKPFKLNPLVLSVCIGLD
jgi:hypothetical protein